MLAGEYCSVRVCCGVTVSGDDKACGSSLCEGCGHRQSGLDTTDTVRFNSPRVPGEGTFSLNGMFSCGLFFIPKTLNSCLSR